MRRERDVDADDSAAPQEASALSMAPAKLAIMYVATLGIYSVYWFYAHWAFYKRQLRMQISPVARGIFSIFYANQLFKTLDNQARNLGYRPSWNPGQQAVLYVALVMGARVLDRLVSGNDALSIVALVCSLASVLPLVSAQKVANLAAGRERNPARSFTLSATDSFCFFQRVPPIALSVGCVLPPDPPTYFCT